MFLFPIAVSSFADMLGGGGLSKKQKRKPESEGAGPSKKSKGESSSRVPRPTPVVPSFGSFGRGSSGRGKQLALMTPPVPRASLGAEKHRAAPSSSSSRIYVPKWKVTEDDRATDPEVAAELLMKGVLPKDAEFTGKLGFEKLSDLLATSLAAVSLITHDFWFLV